MGGKSDISRIFLRYSYGHSFFFATDKKKYIGLDIILSASFE